MNLHFLASIVCMLSVNSVTAMQLTRKPIAKQQAQPKQEPPLRPHRSSFG